MKQVKALVLTGYGLNCDYETDFSLVTAGAESHRHHINELIRSEESDSPVRLEDYDILVFGGGFSWADDHGAGILLATKMKNHLGEQIEGFIEKGKLILGICNGFQTLVNMGLLPGFQGTKGERSAALTYNDSGNFIDTWVRLKINPDSPCVFTRGMSFIELPVRHGEGKFYASGHTIERLFENNQVALQYADKNGNAAEGRWPLNPNGSIGDIAGICDPSGKIFGLMPHPEAFNHVTNHPDWTRDRDRLFEKGKGQIPGEGEGIRFFRNAVDYIRENV